MHVPFLGEAAYSTVEEKEEAPDSSGASSFGYPNLEVLSVGAAAAPQEVSAADHDEGAGGQSYDGEDGVVNVAG